MQLARITSKVKNNPDRIEKKGKFLKLSYTTLVLLISLLSKRSSAAHAALKSCTSESQFTSVGVYILIATLRKPSDISLSDKKAACFALGGYLKMARSLTLLECEIDCCTGKNCNTQIPTGSPSANAVKVFTTAGN